MMIGVHVLKIRANQICIHLSKTTEELYNVILRYINVSTF